MDKTKSTHKPLLTWVLLWVLGTFLIGTRNDLKLQGYLSSLQDTIIADIYFNILTIPIVLTVWFVIKFVLRKMGKSQVLNGNNGVRNAFIFWVVLFSLLFGWGFIG
ncbi:hypothetical protein HYW46_02205 [Candidatus Daviesbacteria bacterium]|nr:hypothetical protein [Candidatus Daviesbacteria bacterium]